MPLPNLKHEDQIEEEAHSRTGIFRNIRIVREEYTRFALFGSMFFIIGFIYSFMRILKDLFVMKRQDPSCFNFIKIIYILPISFLVVLYINYLLQNRTVSKIFNMCLIVFITLFIGFGICIVFEEQVMFDSKGIKTRFENSNFFLKYFMYTVAEPIATLIYISAELWGSIILSYLFLSYLNESCSERQHGRFIPPLFILTNISLLTSAIATTLMLKAKESMDDYQLKIFMGGIFFCQAGLGVLILVLKFYLEKNIMSTPIFIPTQQQRGRKSKPKVSFKESFRIMTSSKFLIAMCGIVFFYNALYNLVETAYKFGIKAGAQANNVDKADYSAKFNNYDQYITSLAVICLNMSSFSHLADSRGWKFVAMISPIVGIFAVASVFGLGMYNSAVQDESFSFVNKMFISGTSFLFLENLLGILTLSAMKIFKYTAFDVTKERISMRIEDRYRPKFKSIYDGIFNKFGKSAGSLYSIIVGGLFGDIDPRGASPLTGALSCVFVIFWIYGINYLGGNYDRSLEKKQNIDIDLFGDTNEDGENKKEVAKKPMIDSSVSIQN